MPGGGQRRKPLPTRLVKNRIPPFSNFGRIEASRGNDSLPVWVRTLFFNHKDLKGDAKGAEGNPSEMLLFCRIKLILFAGFGPIGKKMVRQYG